MKYIKWNLWAIGSLCIFITPANAQPDHMKLGKLTSQPIGHYEYCQSYINDCRIKSNNTKPLKLSKKLWKDLVEINTFSNTTIEPVTDQEGFGVEEYWTYPKSYGDCEDYVLMKRYMLMQRGWSASNLLITVVRQPNGEGHAVLTVRTSKADYILDNLSDTIKPWNETEYTYLKRQSEKHSGKWVNIEDNKPTLGSLNIKQKLFNSSKG